MANVKISIFDHQRTKKTLLSVPDNIEMRRLVPAIAKKLQLPMSDESGNVVYYRLQRDSSGNVVPDVDDFEYIKPTEGESFTLVAERVLIEHNQPESLLLGENVTQFYKPDQAILDSVDLLAAPIYIPNRDSLAIGLVPSDIVYRLEEYRSDQMKWETILWIFVGAVLGIVINWITSDPIVISRTSVVVLIILIIVSVVIGVNAREYKKRADEMKSKILDFHKSSRPIS